MDECKLCEQPTDLFCDFCEFKDKEMGNLNKIIQKKEAEIQKLRLVLKRVKRMLKNEDVPELVLDDIDMALGLSKGEE